MVNSSLDQIRTALHQAQSVLILAHVRPDGDAIGAMLGFGSALNAVGKNIIMVSTDGISTAFRHMNGVENILRKPKGSFDLVVSLDCADIDRVSGLPEGQIPDINIDHHITNQYFGKINLVDPDSAATSELLAKNFKEWGLPLSREVAETLLFGIVSDTLGFRTSNTTPQTLRIASDLVELGANISQITIRALMQRSFTAAKYWGAGLSRLEIKDRLVWTYLTLEDRQKSGYKGSDDADLNAVLSNIEESDISLLFIEQTEGKVKVSWRASEGLDVSQLALSFGGGGHPGASGADLSGSLDEVIAKVIPPTEALLHTDSHFENLENPNLEKKFEQGS